MGLSCVGCAWESSTSNKSSAITWPLFTASSGVAARPVVSWPVGLEVLVCSVGTTQTSWAVW